MPEATKPVQKMDIAEMEKTKKAIEADIRNEKTRRENLRLNSHATVEMVERIDRKIDGQHYQMVNANQALKNLTEFFSKSTVTKTEIRKVPHGKFVGWSIVLLDIAFFVLLNCQEKSTAVSPPMTALDVATLAIFTICSVMCGIAAFLLIEHGE